MYINQRSQQVRNISLSVANGSITLIILLIAPLGLAAVIINTIAITISTYLTAIASDRVIKYLQPRNAAFQPPENGLETDRIDSREHNKLRR
jgi:hypothetical protein